MGRRPKVQGLTSPVLQQSGTAPPGPVPVQERQIVESQREEVSDENQQPLSSVQASLMDFLAESLGGDDLSMFGSLPGIIPPPLIGAGKSDFFMNDVLLEAPSTSDGLFDFGMPSAIDYAKGGKVIKEEQTNQEPKDQEEEKIEEDEEKGGEEEELSNYQPRIVQVTNYQAQQQNHTIKAEPMEEEMEDETEKEELYSIEPCQPSGFTRNPRRNWPWLQEALDSDDMSIPSENLRLMSVHEEQKLFERLQRIFSLEKQCQVSIPAYVRRLYRKLSLRKWKREHNRPIFNLDEHIDPLGRARLKMQTHKVLDRYQLLAHSNQSARSSFHARLAGCTQYELFESPYSQRVLHPFIFRSETLAPPWLKLMCELQHRVNRTHPTRSTIDFCYVRPQHIPAVNALLQSSFWPNIDGECLGLHIFRIYILFFFFCSKRVPHLSGLQCGRSVQETGRGLWVSGAGCRLQRGVHLLHGRASELAEESHCQFYAVPSHPNVLVQRYHPARLRQQLRGDAVPEVWLQNGGDHPGLLRHLLAIRLEAEQKCFLFKITEMKGVEINSVIID